MISSPASGRTAVSVFKEARFHDEEAARLFVEAHLWPNGAVCPFCGSGERVTELKGASTKPGTRKCRACRKLFSVTKGTVFESSHIPLHKWLVALYLLCSSKKGISSHQLHRTLGVTLKTAWFMSHRLREAMRDDSLAPLGGGHGFGNAAEADETFIGRKEGAETPKGGYSHKNAVLALVERGGKVKRVLIDSVTSEEIGRHVRENVAHEAWLMTDEGRHYRQVGTEFAGHSRVHHTRGEYVDPEDATIHTNTVEGFFSVFKRGMKGNYQHCREKHLHRYVAEFEFRYNNRIALGIGDRAVRKRHC